MTLRRPFWVFLGVLIGCALGASVTRALIYFRLIYICVIIIAGSFVWTYFSVKGIRIRRTSRVKRQQVGQVFVEQFEVVNQFSLMRVWLEIQDLTPMEGKAGSTVMSWLGPKQRRMYATHSQLHERGLFPLGPTKIISGDPFGLFTNSVMVPATDQLVVLPYIASLEVMPSPPGFLAGGRVTGRKSMETTPQAMGVRDYQPGDSLSKIHWRTTARRGELMVKEFDQDPRADVWIFLDAERKHHVREAVEKPHFETLTPLWKLRQDFRVVMPADSFEYAVSAAGSIADYYLREGRGVGYVSYGQSLTVLSIESGDRQHSRILDHLAFVRCEGKMDLLGLVQAQAPNLVRGSIVVLLTTTRNNRIPYLIDSLMQWRLNPIVAIVDLASFGDPADLNVQISTMVTRDIPLYAIRKWITPEEQNELLTSLS